MNGSTIIDATQLAVVLWHGEGDNDDDLLPGHHADKMDCGFDEMLDNVEYEVEPDAPVEKRMGNRVECM